MRPRIDAVKWLVALAAVALVPGRPAAQDAPPVRVGGVVHSQYEHLLSDDADHAHRFDVTRAYVTLLGSFPAGIGTRVTADIRREEDGSLGYRLKYAYLQWRPEGSPVGVRFGQLNTPWIDWEEGLWGYRMQGRVMLDREGYLTSSDIGASVDAGWRDELLNGSLAVVNGEGYASRPDGRSLDVAARASLRLLATGDASARGGLRLSGYGHLGRDADGLARDRWIGMLSYRSRLATVAGEYAWLRSAGLRGRALGTFGTLAIPGTGLGLMARLDRVDPDRAGDDDALTRVIGGVSYALSPSVRLLADVETTRYDGGAPTPELHRARDRLLFQTEVVF
jgi:hypothetical protein